MHSIVPSAREGIAGQIGVHLEEGVWRILPRNLQKKSKPPPKHSNKYNFARRNSFAGILWNEKQRYIPTSHHIFSLKKLKAFPEKIKFPKHQFTVVQIRIFTEKFCWMIFFAYFLGYCMMSLTLAKKTKNPPRTIAWNLSKVNAKYFRFGFSRNADVGRFFFTSLGCFPYSCLLLSQHPTFPIQMFIYLFGALHGGKRRKWWMEKSDKKFWVWIYFAFSLRTTWKMAKEEYLA